MFERSTIVTMDVHHIDLPTATEFVADLAANRIGSYTCAANVHMCMESLDSPEFRSIVNGSDLVVPDGRPIFWAMRILGGLAAKQIRGEDLFNSLCAVSVGKRLNIGLYGGANEEVLNNVVQSLKCEYPDLNIVYSYSPPFRPLNGIEDDEVVSSINDSVVNLLFVGIGCPKQERWMAEHKQKLGCTMVGVGAAFDFVAGTKKSAPKAMQFFGFEWLFRLSSEPGRLWKRYLKHNPRFIWFFLRQWIATHRG